MAEAPQPRPRPVPAPRTKLLKKNPPKEEPPPEWFDLLASIVVFERGEVKLQTIPAEVERAARDYLRVKLHLQYQHIDLRKLIRENQVLIGLQLLESDIQRIYTILSSYNSLPKHGQSLPRIRTGFAHNYSMPVS